MRTVENRFGRATPEDIAKRDPGKLSEEVQSNLRRRMGFRDPNIVPPEELTPEYKRLVYGQYLYRNGKITDGELRIDQTNLQPIGKPATENENFLSLTKNGLKQD